MKIHALSEPRNYPRSRPPAGSRRSAGEDAADETARFVDGYLPALLAQAHDLIASEFHAVAADHGLQPSEWRVLATLASGAPMSISRLAQIVVMKQPTVTRVLDRMEVTGHLRRVPHGEDRRITLVGITPAGKVLAARLVALARAHEAEVLRPFGAGGASGLKQMLLKLIALARRGEAAEPEALPQQGADPSQWSA